MKKTAILVGATGLIGHDLLYRLLKDENYDKILIITRKTSGISHPKLEEIVTDFDEMDKHAAKISGDVVFCALGSTAKKTPDLKIYRKIDYEYPLALAKIALKNGARQYHLVSSMGANVNSSIFYSRTKGEVERDLAKLSIPSLQIYRPSLLDGRRKEERSFEIS